MIRKGIKIQILIAINLLLVVGCTENKNIDVITSEKIDEVVEDTYIDDNPIIIGIYDNDISLIKEYSLVKESRIEKVFSFYYTNEENLGSNKNKENWYKFYSNYTDIDDYKIGFHFSFYVEDTLIEKTILNPYVFSFEPYFYIYFYDDINQPDNTFYSHLEEEDVNENTIFSSIKIFLMEPWDITSPIKFTVFTYNGLEDFDENNNYRGNSKYQIDINLI